MSVRERIQQVSVALSDPPDVHFKDAAYGLVPPSGVWRTDAECYEYLAAHCKPGMRTLETGLGISTVLFTQWRCMHTCVVPWKIEYDKLAQYLGRRGIDDTTLHV